MKTKAKIRVKNKNRSKNSQKPKETEAKKYQDIVSSHPVEATSVTRQEKIKEDRKKLVEGKVEQQLEKQSLFQRILKTVKKW